MPANISIDDRTVVESGIFLIQGPEKTLTFEYGGQKVVLEVDLTGKSSTEDMKLDGNTIHEKIRPNSFTSMMMGLTGEYSIRIYMAQIYENQTAFHRVEYTILGQAS